MLKYDVNIIGQTFHRITIIRPTVIKKYKQYFECKCSCGKIFETSGSAIRSGNTKSCGCLNTERRSQLNKNKFKNKHRNYLGYEDISGAIFHIIKKSAQKRGIEFLITIKDMWDLFIKQNRKCALTGVDLKFNSSLRNTDGTASLDRIDSSKGYTLDNIQWIHQDLNYMKSDFTTEEFFNWIKKLYEFNKLNSIPVIPVSTPEIKL